MTIFKKFFKISAIVAILLVFICLTGFILLKIFPQAIFKNRMDYKNFTVYSNNVPDKNIIPLLDEVDKRLRSSELHKNTTPCRLFLCDNFFKYFLLSPIVPDAFAATSPSQNKIVLAKTDIPNNLSFSKRKENNKRPLDGLITHETVHLLQYAKYGKSAFWGTASWKYEGYAEYISKESSFSVSEGLNKFKQSQNDDNISYKYFVNRLRVTYLIDVKNLSYDTIHKSSFNLLELDKEIRTNLDNPTLKKSLLPT